jgi:uncharacterized protein YgiM (DUF1202 family)
MKKITLIVIVLFAAITAFFFFTRESKAEGCGGRCTGSSSCSACRNCSRCAHCSNGGTCGVCSTGSSYSAPTPKKHTSSSSPKSNSPSHSTKVKSIVKTYYVKTSILNIRKEPSKTSDVICTVKKKEKVKILKKYNDNWYYVQITCHGKKAHGYITKGSIL